MPADRAPRATALGLDLGGTKLLAALVAADGTRLASRRVATPAGPPAVVLDAMAELAADLRGEAGGAAPVAAGVGFPGLVDVERGVARSSVILREWRDVPLAAELGRRLALPVALDNDVHQAARGELAARGGGEPDLLFVAVGTGIGGALVLRGAIWGGAGGLAGEVGHVAIERDGPECACGRRGCVGAVASAGAIERRLGLPRGGLPAAVAANDARATAALAEAADALGFALASVVNLLAPPLVVIGGGVPELAPGFVDGSARALRRFAMAEIGAATRVERARAGYEAGAVGAALHAWSLRKSAST